MKIVKEGHVIIFDCTSCGCRFVVGAKQLSTTDGNYYARCPECGTECHTDMSDLARFKEEASRKCSGS